MAVELKVPSAGESITEVTVVEWLKEEGAWADTDEAVALIETDKANVEVVAPVAGRIEKILKPAGEMAEVGEVIGTMAESAGRPDSGADDGAGARPSGSANASGEAPREAPRTETRSAKPKAEPPRTETAAKPQPARDPAGGAVGATPRPSPAPAGPPARATPSPEPASSGNGQAALVHASPSVRRLMREHDLPLDRLEGTGPGGRIQAEDIRRYVRAEPTEGSRQIERVPMTPMRRRIAQRLVQSQSEMAVLSTFNEVDMSAVMALRKKHQDEFVKRHGIKLGFMSFFVKAAVEALKEFPEINASIEDDQLVYHDYYDIGVAVGGGKGLVVPVIRNAERSSFAQVEKTIADFAERAQSNRLNVEELQGGTFTISNGGVYGSLLSTPIINPPQSGILGMHAIQQRPVVKEGQVVPAPMMYVALSYDHRIVDGKGAVSFLVRLKELVENPQRILLEM